MNFKHTIDCELPLSADVFLWCASVVVSVVTLVMLTNYIVSWIAFVRYKQDNSYPEEEDETYVVDNKDADYSEYNNPFIKVAKKLHEKL